MLVNVRALNGVRAELVVEPMEPDFEPVGVVFRVVREGLDIIRASLGTKYDYSEFWRKGYMVWRQLLGRAAFLQYEAVASPFPARWPPSRCNVHRQEIWALSMTDFAAHLSHHPARLTDGGNR